MAKQTIKDQGVFTKRNKDAVNDNFDELYAAPPSGALTDGHVYVGDASNLAQDVAMSGDVHISNTGATTLQTVAGAVKSSSASAGVGYATGAGGAVEQGSSRTTAVVLNTVCGAITLVSAAGSATPASFTLTNSRIAATDVVLVSQKSGTDKYEVFVTAVGTGSCQITSFTTGGTTTEQPVFNFVVVKAVAA